MKILLVSAFCGTLLLSSGCATNHATAGHEDRRRGRVDRQWAHEAGLPPTDWHYKRLAQREQRTTGGPGGPEVTPLPPLTEHPHPGPGHPGQPGPVQPGPIVSGDIELQLCQEELVVGKRQVNNGAVIIRKIVKSEPASATVTLNREDYVIERVPGTAREGTNDCFTGKEIVLCLTKEEAVVGTRVNPTATEIIRIRKQIHTDQRTVHGTIRKESYEVVKLADCPTNNVPHVHPHLQPAK